MTWMRPLVVLGHDWLDLIRRYPDRMRVVGSSLSPEDDLIVAGRKHERGIPRTPHDAFLHILHGKQQGAPERAPCCSLSLLVAIMYR